ncbi:MULTISPECIES: hypothetical protein [unclassified Streptomyces]|uniref:hypothetical protein n=2 Tax=unclassified Streptomyces TaxID=2593676 RepID=UPI00324943A1
MPTRRRFLTMTALATGAGLTPWALPGASAATPALELTTYIDGQRFDRTAVLQWEARRLKVAAERLSHHLPAALWAELGALLDDSAPSVETVSRDREQLADVKLRMGHTQIRDQLACDLAITEPMSVLAAAMDEWSASRTRVDSSRGTAQGFLDWFNARIEQNDERAMLVANPDHYLISSPRAGAQEVIEVTGGAMLAAQFFIDYSDTAGVPIEKDPLYPIETSGWARTSDGTKIGAVRHQFRDNPGGGFSAKLTVAFPATLPPWMFTEHQWHLACEFSNWVTGYIDAALA